MSEPTQGRTAEPETSAQPSNGYPRTVTVMARWKMTPKQRAAADEQQRREFDAAKKHLPASVVEERTTASEAGEGRNRAAVERVAKLTSAEAAPTTGKTE